MGFDERRRLASFCRIMITMESLRADDGYEYEHTRQGHNGWCSHKWGISSLATFMHSISHISVRSQWNRHESIIRMVLAGWMMLSSGASGVCDRDPIRHKFFYFLHSWACSNAPTTETNLSSGIFFLFRDVKTLLVVGWTKWNGLKHRTAQAFHLQLVHSNVLLGVRLLFLKKVYENY